MSSKSGPCAGAISQPALHAALPFVGVPASAIGKRTRYRWKRPDLGRSPAKLNGPAGAGEAASWAVNRPFRGQKRPQAAASSNDLSKSDTAVVTC